MSTTTTTTPAPAPAQMSSTLKDVEDWVNLISPVAAAFGPVGQAVATGVPVVEGVVNTVVDEAPHQTALTDIQNGITAAAPIVTAAAGAISPTHAAAVTSGMNAISAILAALKSFL